MCSPDRSLLCPCVESFSLLLPCYVPTFKPIIITVPVSAPVLAHISRLGSFAVLLSYSMLATISYPRSPTVLLSYCVPTLVSHLGSPTISSSCHTLVFCCGILALLLPLFMLGPPLSLRSSVFKTFK